MAKNEGGGMPLVCRKLQMIIGESNGPPHDRVVRRLAAMLPKALGRGEEIPEEVAKFIDDNELEDWIKAEAAGIDIENVDQSADVPVEAAG